MQKKLSEIIWSEKYRPQKVEHLILPERLRNRFIGNEIGQSLLFGGPAGTGKTSLAKILAKDRSTLFINGSSNRGIDVVRKDIHEFGSTASLISSKKKVIIIDEGDKFTSAAQDALKATIEQCSNNVFFIFTANNPERLSEPLHSRLEYINFNFSAEEEREQKVQYIKRIQLILKNEGGYKISNDSLKYIITQLYPDMRKIISTLYKASRSIKPGEEIKLKDIASDSLLEFNDLYTKLLEEWRPNEMYKFVKSHYTGKEYDVMSTFSTHFLEFINKHEKHNTKTLSAAVIVQKYSYEMTTGSVNPMVTLLACCHMLAQLFKS